MKSRREFIIGGSAAFIGLVAAPLTAAESYVLNLRDAIDVLCSYPVYHVKELRDEYDRPLRGRTMHEDEHGSNLMFLSDSYDIDTRREAVVHELTHAVAKLKGIELSEEHISETSSVLARDIYNGSIHESFTSGNFMLSLKDVVDFLKEGTVEYDSGIIYNGLHCFRNKVTRVHPRLSRDGRRGVIIHEILHHKYNIYSNDNVSQAASDIFRQMYLD